MTDERDKLFAKLREPFPPEHVGKLPKPTKKEAQKGKCLPQKEGGQAPAWQDYCCGDYHGLPAVHLDFVGHAAVTSRLLEVDPEWTWEPKAGWDDNGEPKFVRSPKGDPIRLWITLTVLGVTRPGVGTVDPGTRDPEKQLIGDALRNAAMRFGVALDLWIKGQEEEHADTKAEEAPSYAGADEARAKELGWASLHQLAEAHDALRRLIKDTDDASRERAAAYKKDQGLHWPMSPDELGALTAEVRKPEQIVAPEDGQLVDVEHPPHVPTSEMDLTPVPLPDEDPEF